MFAIGEHSPVVIKSHSPEEVSINMLRNRQTFILAASTLAIDLIALHQQTVPLVDVIASVFILPRSTQ